ncbi:hypothetical protein EDB92DRAFT_1943829 [Lactarius akahatsu]|uniref:PWI domain-containing protein n=1 Tax=Lactarius akahatsu TaxID=416441 RepID=A0AAD4LN85_9AGAM|nr:hypothetical protein EDB92DRAFT_1943829 [Lactarius akahatsu]
MADAGFFKGTSADQDRRFSDKELKLLKTLKFPSQFDTKVDMRKVNLQVIRPWVTKKVVELLGLDDELVVEYAMGLLEDESQPTPDPKKMQINLTGFLTDSTPVFMAALWNLLIEAQTSPAGIPRSFVEEKKEEMRRANQGDTRALDERDRRQRLDEIRDRERSESVHDIAPRLLVLVHLRPVAGRPPAIAHLVRVALHIALAPAAPSARVRVAHLHAVDLPPLEVLLRHHRVAAAAARHLTHHETTNGTARVEGATAVAHRPGEDVSARRRVGALPVGALTTLVADAVQAHVVAEKVARCPASGRLPVGSGTDVRTEAGVEVQRTGEAQKGRLAGAEAGRGARVSVDTKGQAEAERQRNKMDTTENADVSQDSDELARRESELKEKALRNKVVRTRKRTTSNPDSSSVKGSS